MSAPLSTNRLWCERLLSLLAALLFCTHSLLAATYYVSPAGSDARSEIEAQRIETPWQSINYAVSQLAPGDTLLLRGGTYHEEVVIGVSGTAADRIRIVAFPGESPVLAGTTVLTGWRKCLDQADARGNPNWQYIYRVDVPSTHIADIGAVELFTDGTFMRIAQWPDQPSDACYQVQTLYEPLEAESFTFTDRLIDSSFLIQPDDFWNGASVWIWAHAANNVIVKRRIADYVRSTQTILFDTPLDQPLTGSGSLPDAYSIVNHAAVLDSPGEFCHTTTQDLHGNYTFYVWPLKSTDLQSRISVASMSCGIRLISGGGSYLDIDGLSIMNYSATGTRAGGIVCPYGVSHARLTVKNCNIRNINGCGGISLQGGNGDIVQQNTVVNIKSGFGISVAGGSHSSAVTGNVVNFTERTGICFFGVDRGLIHANRIGRAGGHGNAITTYLGCSNILIAGNTTEHSNIAYTVQASSNITLYNNLFHGTADKIVADWGGNTGFLRILNNALVGPEGGTALYVQSSPERTIVNNIIHAGGDGVRHHNVYTKLAWNQSARGGWTLGEGELTADKSEVYADPEMLAFTPRAGSLAVDAGADITSLLPTTDFPDFDFTVDLAGNPRIVGAAVDIGPSEYSPHDAPVQNPVAVIAQPAAGSTVPYGHSDAITLDGRTSYDPDGGHITAWIWTDERGHTIAEGAQTTTALPAGSHIIRLTVTDDEDASSIASAAIIVADLESSLTGHWGFDETAGTTADDASNNSSPAKLINGPVWSQDAKIQGSLQLDGVDDHIILGDSAFDLSAELTVAFWMRPSDMDFTGYHALVHRGEWGHPFAVTLRDRSVQTFIRTSSGTDWLTSPTVIQADRWYHVALTRKDGARVMYLDGEIDIIDPTPPSGLLAAGAGYETTVGAWQAVGGAYFKGHIDDLRIYNAALSASDIRQLYKNGCRSAEWAIDGFSGTTAPDDSGNSNPGTLANGPLWTGYSQLRLDGINDMVNCGTGAHLNQTSSLTLCAWIYPEHYGLIGDARIVDKGDSPAGFAFYLKNDGRLAYMAGSAEVVSDAAAVRLNEWQHVALSYSDNLDTVTFYVDGQPAGTVSNYQTNPMDSLNSPLIIGNNAALTHGFKGMLTDVRIYSRALEASEIKAIYETWEVKENKLVAFDLTAADTDGTPLEYVIQTPAPEGARCEGNVFSWRPWYNQAGSYDITFEALNNPDYTHRVPIVVEEVALESWYRYWLQCLNRY